MRTKDASKQDSIREQVIEMVVKEGLDGFSMQKLAKAANVSPATLYIYYKDKEDLIIQVCTEVSSQMLEHSLKGFDPDASFEEGMRIQWKNRAAYYKKYSREVEFVEQIRYTPLYEKVSEALRSTTRGGGFKEKMGRFVHGAIARKELVQLPFEVYWSIAFAPLYQLIKFNSAGSSYMNKTFSLSNKMMMQALELTLKALKP